MKTFEKKQQFHMGGSIVLAMEMVRHILRIKLGKDVRWTTLDITTEAGSTKWSQWDRHYEDRRVYFRIEAEHPTGMNFIELRLMCLVSHLQKPNQRLEWWEPQWVEIMEPSWLAGCILFATWDQTGGKLMTVMEHTAGTRVRTADVSTA